MHRRDTKGHENGRFTDGDSTGPEIKEATVLDASWLNDVQEEIAHVIESEGVRLSKRDSKQLSAALCKIAERGGYELVCRQPGDLMQALREGKASHILVAQDQEVESFDVKQKELVIHCKPGTRLKRKDSSPEDYFLEVCDGLTVQNAWIDGFKSGFGFHAPDAEDQVYERVSLTNCFVSHPEMEPSAERQP